jgi:hypothetical protein
MRHLDSLAARTPIIPTVSKRKLLEERIVVFRKMLAERLRKARQNCEKAYVTDLSAAIRRCKKEIAGLEPRE